MMRAIVYLGLALLPAAAAAETVTVRIGLRDGTRLNGTLGVSEFRLKTGGGEARIAAANLRMVAVSSAEWIVETRDGQRVRGTPTMESWKLITSLGEVTVRSADMTALRVTALDGKPEEGVPPDDAPVAATDPALKTLAEFPIPGQISGGSRLSADGGSLYVLDVTASKFISLDTSTLRPRFETTLAAGMSSFTFLADGKSALCVAKYNLFVTDLATGVVTRTFAVDKELTCAMPLDDDCVLASGTSGLYSISLSRQAIVRTSGRGLGRVRVHPSGRLAFGSGFALRIPDGVKRAEDLVPQLDPVTDLQSGGESMTSFTPDGRLGFDRTGAVYRVGRSYAATLCEIGAVDAHVTSVVLPASGRILLFTQDARMIQRSLETFAEIKTERTATLVLEALADEKQGLLYLFVANQGGAFWHASLGPGTWRKVDLPK